MEFNVFGYTVTIEKGGRGVYDLVMNHKISRRKRARLMHDIVSTKIDRDDYSAHTKITAIRKARKLYGLGLREAKDFVEELFPYYECGSIMPVFKEEK